MRKIAFVVVIAVVAILLGMFLAPRKSNGPTVSIVAEFENKVVYGTDQSSLDQAALKKDCDARGGTFNACGSVCGPEAEACIQVCAFTCEL